VAYYRRIGLVKEKYLRLRIVTWLALMGVLMIAACASGGNGADTDKNNGFYGGASGGWSHP
jgi:hypothetical protein